MSNFICPHCQQIIDDGSDGFTSNREIELEKKLEIAVKALEHYRDGEWWYGYEWQEGTDGWEIAEKALAEIKEIK